MERAGSTSWCFAQDVSQPLNVLLYFREVLGLSVLPPTVAPPRVVGADEIQPAPALDVDDPRTADEEFTAWWARVLGYEAGRQLATANRAAPRRDRSGRQQVFDPPDWHCLDGSVLRGSVRDHFVPARRWSLDRQQEIVGSCPGALFDPSVLADLAAEAAERRQVPMGGIAGAVLIIAVAGPWWALLHEGVAVCSIMATRDPTIARRIAAKVFASTT
jgi:hypothetical protein